MNGNEMSGAVRWEPLNQHVRPANTKPYGATATNLLTMDLFTIGWGLS